MEIKKMIILFALAILVLINIPYFVVADNPYINVGNTDRKVLFIAEDISIGTVVNISIIEDNPVVDARFSLISPEGLQIINNIQSNINYTVSIDTVGSYYLDITPHNIYDFYGRVEVYSPDDSLIISPIEKESLMNIIMRKM